MSRVGIVVALAGEARSLGLAQCRVGIAEIIPGARVAVCGVGARRASSGARQLLKYGVSGLVSFGVAGGLSSSLRTGDLVLPETVRGPEGDVVRAHPEWHESALRALAALAPVSAGALWSSESPVVSVEDKRRLAGSGLAAVDMESGAVGEAAASGSIPFLAIKAICDPAERAVAASVPGLLDGQGRFRWRGLPAFVAGGPVAWRSAGALRGDFASACGALSKAASALPVILGREDVNYKAEPE